MSNIKEIPRENFKTKPTENLGKGAFEVVIKGTWKSESVLVRTYSKKLFFNSAAYEEY